MTGAVDYITNGREVAAVANGHEWLGGVTAMGCTVSAIVGACLAVETDALAATVDGLTLFGIAGEVAAERSSGPASFRIALIDALAALDEATIAQRIHID